jgi:hypothetical protein
MPSVRDRKPQPPTFQEAFLHFSEARVVSIWSPKGREMKSKQDEFELVHYDTSDCVTDFTLDPTNETVWATQQQMGELFGIDRTVVGKHLKNIYDDKELDQGATSAKFAHVQIEGGREVTRQVEYYNLDAILSVGYRVNSGRATAFRKWATETLKAYLVQGYALNEARLRDDPGALKELAARVRALRSDEKNIYAGVRDVFAFASIDYDSKSPAARSFFARLQDKFLYAITGQTASQLILARADGKLPDMGLHAIKGLYPTKAEVRVGKNYLGSDELYGLHILCEQFLLFVESRALRGLKITMTEMSEKFDELLKVQGHPVFAGYKDFLKDRAISHAEKEMIVFQRQIELEEARAERRQG